MRILVTGASGFIGAHCVPLLQAGGHEVHAVSPFPEPYPDGVQVHIEDLLHSDTRQLMAQVRPTHCLHLAWHVPPNQFWTAIENVRWLEASLRLLEAFAAAGGRRWVGAGTCAEYDWSQGGVFRESDPTSPGTLYGAAKASLRITAERLAEQLGIELAWGRIFFPFGPGEPASRIVPSVIRSLLAGKNVPCTEGLQVRDFIYAADVGAAFAALATSSYRGVVNIGSGVPVTVRQLALRIGEMLGQPELLEFGALPSRSFEPHELVADISRLRSLGFEPRYSLDQGLRETIGYWQSRS